MTRDPRRPTLTPQGLRVLPIPPPQPLEWQDLPKRRRPAGE